MWRCSQRSSNSSLHARASLHARGAPAAPAPAVEFLFSLNRFFRFFSRVAHTLEVFDVSSVPKGHAHMC